MLSRALPDMPTSWLATRALLFVAVAVVVGMAFAVTRAEASGDAFGDSATVDGFIDGPEKKVLGPDDGHIVQIGTTDGGGSVTVSFDNNLAFNGPGADIRVHTLDALAPATATIEVSADGSSFVSAGDFADDAGSIDIDLGTLGLDFAVAVRITHVSGDLPGFDLDAVEALNAIDLIDLTPASSQNLVSTDHTATASLEMSGTPVEGAIVSLLITDGPNAGATNSAVTDASGEAALTYTSDGVAGTDSITAWLDLDDDGGVDAAEPQATATKEWLALGDIDDLEPETDTNLLNTDHTVTATLTSPIADVEVRFEVVSGPNSGDVGTATSAADGTASFT